MTAKAFTQAYGKKGFGLLFAQADAPSEMEKEARALIQLARDTSKDITRMITPLLKEMYPDTGFLSSYAPKEQDVEDKPIDKFFANAFSTVFGMRTSGENPYRAALQNFVAQEAEHAAAPAA